MVGVTTIFPNYSFIPPRGNPQKADTAAHPGPGMRRMAISPIRRASTSKREPVATRPHSFRRANISWRQEVGGSAIEASKIAGHAQVQVTSQYTYVGMERQHEFPGGLFHPLQTCRFTPAHPALDPTTPALMWNSPFAPLPSSSQVPSVC